MQHHTLEKCSANSLKKILVKENRRQKKLTHTNPEEVSDITDLPLKLNCHFIQSSELVQNSGYRDIESSKNKQFQLTDKPVLCANQNFSCIFD